METKPQFKEGYIQYDAVKIHYLDWGGLGQPLVLIHGLGSKKVYAKIFELQPLTKLSIYDKQTHVWLLDNINTESSNKAFTEIRNFIDD